MVMQNGPTLIENLGNSGLYVRDPEISFTQVHHPGSKIILRGSALPHADSFSFSDVSDLSTRKNGTVTLQNPVGFSNGTVTMSGEWVDARIKQDYYDSTFFDGETGDGVALDSSEKLRLAFRTMQADGVRILLRTGWGDAWTGRISNVDYTLGQRGRLKWSMSFEPVDWSFSSPYSAEHSLAFGTLPPQNGYDPLKEDLLGQNPALAVADVAQSSFDILEWVEKAIGSAATFVQDILDVLSGLADTFDRINGLRDQAIQILNNAMAQTAATVQRFVDGALSWHHAVRDLGAIAARARGACLIIEQSMDGNVEYGWSSDPFQQQRDNEVMSSCVETARALGGYYAYLQAWCNAQDDAGKKSASEYAEYEIKQGDTLRSIAARYGDADQWWLIADENGLSSDVELVRGRRIVIPLWRMRG